MRTHVTYVSYIVYLLGYLSVCLSFLLPASAGLRMSKANMRIIEKEMDFLIILILQQRQKWKTGEVRKKERKVLFIL